MIDIERRTDLFDASRIQNHETIRQRHASNCHA